MITVCFVVESHVDAVLGGAEYQAHMLADELGKRPGVSVFYLARRVSGTPPAVKYPYAIQQIGTSRGIRGRAVLFDAADLERTLREIRPDVIYQRMKQSYTGICARYAENAGIPLFFHVASGGDVLRRPRWRSMANLPFDMLEVLVGNWGVRHATHVVVQTRQQERLLAENFGVRAYALVPNFHPLPATLPVKPDGPMRVLWVANIHWYKRPELFVQLAAAFANRDDVQFQMVGRPDTNKRLRSTMAAIERQSNVQYFGGLPLEEVNRLMSEAHVFVNTSNVEGFPNTFIQAWSRGAVVVSLEVDIDGGLDAQKIGFRAGSPARLRDIVDSLARSHPTRQAIAQNAFEYALRHHSLKSAEGLADMIVAAGRQGEEAQAFP